MDATTAIFCFLAFFSLMGAIGVTIARSSLYAVILLLLTITCTSGVLYLMGAGLLGALTLWFLGSTSTLVLFHASLLISMRGSEKSPRRLLIGKFVYIFI